MLQILLGVKLDSYEKIKTVAPINDNVKTISNSIDINNK